MLRYTSFLLSLLALTLLTSCTAAQPAPRWSAEKANQWNEKQPWLVGCNFSPSTAANQLEMWQAETFDPETIDRELGYAQDLGMNFVRVYLHDLVWDQGPDAYLNRIDRFLSLADKHNIRVMLVIFDACWDPHPFPGCQPPPRPFVHNSRWVQSPSVVVLRNPDQHDSLKPYVQGVLKRFKNDPRILLWDLYNEPGNMNGPALRRWESPNKEELCYQLLDKTFAWAREINPSQPLSACVWTGDTWTDSEQLTPLNRYALEKSDVITFHVYWPPEESKKRTSELFAYGRPLICTEYLCRPRNNNFQTLMPFFLEHRIGACNWGFVAGKTQTNYPWESWDRPFTSEPDIWFHDILHPDGSPYIPAETEFIRQITTKANKTP